MSSDETPYAPPKTEITEEYANRGNDESYDLPRSPLTLKGIGLLFFKPKAFFSDHGWLIRQPEIAIVTLMAGFASTISRIDSRMIRTELTDSSASTALVDMVATSWTSYWLTVLGFGLIASMFIWFIAGWWFRVRLNWSGAADVDTFDARVVCMYKEFAYALPQLVLSGIITLVFGNYLEYWNSDEVWSSVLIFFVLYSCYVSYRAALSFPVIRWKAAIWFLILPIAIYMIVFGGVATAYYLLVG